MEEGARIWRGAVRESTAPEGSCCTAKSDSASSIQRDNGEKACRYSVLLQYAVNLLGRFEAAIEARELM